IGVPVKGAQQLRSEADEGNDLRSYAAADSPFGPLLRIHFKIEVDKAIPQRRGHAGSVCPVSISVSGGNDDPVARKHVLPEPTVKNQLIERCLDHRRSSIELVKK